MAQEFNIPIHVDFSTTGAPATQAAMANVARTGNAIEAVAQGPLKNYTKQAGAAGASTRSFGMLASQASYQVTDFTTQVSMGCNAITAFAMQAPQLIASIGAAGVVSAGAALGMSLFSAALPIALFGGIALFKWMDKSEDKSLSLKKSFDWMKDVQKIYQDFADEGKDARDQADRDQAELLKKALQANKWSAEVSVSQTDTEAARQAAQLGLQLSREKTELARTEAGLVTATGTTALTLAKQRAEVVAKIYQTELAIAEAQRQAALGKAEAGLAKAGADVQATGAADNTAFQAFQTQGRVVGDLNVRIEDLIVTQRQMADLYREDLRTKTAELAAMARTGVSERGGPGYEKMESLRLEVANLPAQIAAAEKANLPEIADLVAQRNVQQKLLDDLKPKMESAAEAQKAAAIAMSQATLELRNLRTKQGDERGATEAGKKDALINDSSAPITAAAQQAVNLARAGSSAVAPVSRPPRPGYRPASPGATPAAIPYDPEGFAGAGSGFAGADNSGAADALQKIISDNTPDAQQGASILALIETLKGTLGSKDSSTLASLNSLATTIQNQMAAYTAIEGRIKTLESQSTQTR